MKFLPILFCLLCTGGANAHDAWIEPQEGGFQVLFGHDGKIEPAPAAKIKAVAAIDARGAALAVKAAAGDSPRLSIAGTPALLTLSYDNGYWSKTTEGTKNLPKNEARGALSASHALKFGKTVALWSPAAGQAQGQRLEILPLAVAAPRAGQTLPVQVLLDGKPLPGATLKLAYRAGNDPALVTDAAGKAALPVGGGRNNVSVDHRIALANDPKADMLSLSANLVFDAR